MSNELKDLTGATCLDYDDVLSERKNSLYTATWRCDAQITQTVVLKDFNIIGDKKRRAEKEVRALKLLRHRCGD